MPWSWIGIWTLRFQQVLRFSADDVIQRFDEMVATILRDSRWEHVLLAPSPGFAGYSPDFAATSRRRVPARASPG